MKNIKYIFFDVGYTLINEDDVWSHRCREQAQTDEAKALSLTAENIYNEIVAASLAHKSQYRTVVQKYNLTQIAPYRHDMEKVYPEAKSVLEQLSKKYRLGIIANQADGLVARLEKEGIAHYFTTIVSSFDCQASKPDLKIFEAALQKANCAPSEAVMIGDRLDNDIFPAKSIGMKTVWIKQGFGGMQVVTEDRFEPDVQVSNLTELLNIL